MEQDRDSPGGGTVAALETVEAVILGKRRYRGPTPSRARSRGDRPGVRSATAAPLLGGTALAYVDGSEGSIRALLSVLQHPLDRVVLLYVSPNASEGYLECGWLALEMALHRCRFHPAAP